MNFHQNISSIVLVLITASESKKHREGVKGIVEVDGGNGIHKKFLVLKGNRSEEEENDFDIQHIDHGKIGKYTFLTGVFN